MKKKVLLIIGIIVLACCSIGLFFLIRSNKTDAVKFKKEYESLNGKINEVTNKEYLKLDIDRDNPFIYKSASDIVSMINEKKSFAVLFGYESNEETRIIIPSLIKAAKNMNLSEIYYVDLLDIRDEVIVNSDGTFTTTKIGTDGYYKLLELLDSVLDDYDLGKIKSKKVAKEKRIYEPSIVVIVNGEATALTSGLPELSAPYMNLTDEVQSEIYKLIVEAIKNLNSKNACEVQTAC